LRVMTEKSVARLLFFGSAGLRWQGLVTVPLGDQSVLAELLSGCAAELGADAAELTSGSGECELLVRTPDGGDQLWPLRSDLPAKVQSPDLVNGSEILLGVPAVPRPLPLPLALGKPGVRKLSTGSAALRQTGAGGNAASRALPASARPLADAAPEGYREGINTTERQALHSRGRRPSARSAILLEGMRISGGEQGATEDGATEGLSWLCDSPTDGKQSPISRQLNRGSLRKKPVLPDDARALHPQRSGTITACPSSSAP